METEKFARMCREAFGTKVRFGEVDPEQLQAGLFGGKLQVAPEAVPAVVSALGKQVWLVPGSELRCPSCGELLLISFYWGIKHGEGSCRCGDVTFQAYHYMPGLNVPIVAFAVTGISKRLARKVYRRWRSLKE